MPKPLTIRTDVNSLERASEALRHAFGLDDLLNEPPDRLRLLAKLLRYIADARDEAKEAKTMNAVTEANR